MTTAGVIAEASERSETGGPVTPEESAARLEAEVARVAGVRNAADAELVRLVAAALEGGMWQGSGIHTPVQWLMWRAGLERSTATRIVALARRAGELPVTMRSFDEGRLSLDQAAKVARHTPVAFDASVCQLAENATVAQIAKATRRYDFDAAARSSARTPAEPEPETPDPSPEDDQEERSVTFGTDETTWWARVRLPIEEGAVVETALLATRERLHQEDTKARLSWADALVGMANTTLAHSAAGAERAARTHVMLHLESQLVRGSARSAPVLTAPVNGRPSPASEGHPPPGDSVAAATPGITATPDITATSRGTVTASAGNPDVTSVSGADSGPRCAPEDIPGDHPDCVAPAISGPAAEPAGWVATLHLGPVLPAAVRRYLSCDADAQVVRLVDGRPVDSGRLHRIVPPRLRRLVEHRDQGCRVPGCDRRLWLHVHHIWHWEDGGETTSANTCALCPYHHRLHHKGLLGIEGDANGELVFTDQRGRRLRLVGRPWPPTPDDTPRVPPYRGPTGERLDITAVHFSAA